MKPLSVKLILKKHQNKPQCELHEHAGKTASIIGIAANFILFIGKFLVGTCFSSISIVADAVNNLSDAGSSIISLISFHLSKKPADEKHPFGHARTEYIASMVISFFILLFGIELIKSSVEKILSPSIAPFSWLSVAVLSASILIKLWMFFLNKGLGKTINSSVLFAAATDSLSDVLATLAVLLSSVLSPLLNLPLDGYIGILVALFILFSGGCLIKDSFHHLIGTTPEQSFVKKIKAFILSYDGVLGMHDLLIHSYGPNRCFASVHVEVSAKEDILKSHDMIDNIERDLLKKEGIHLVIHLDPVVTDDEDSNLCLALLVDILHKIDPVLSLHDFRMVHGVTHNLLIFDLVLPYRYRISEAQLTKLINHALQEKNPSLFPIINYDHSNVK